MKPKIKHISCHSIYCHSTERYEVFSYCGYSEEASGSGKHTVDTGEIECETCLRMFKQELDLSKEEW